jgi:hypothetical protein
VRTQPPANLEHPVRLIVSLSSLSESLSDLLKVPVVLNFPPDIEGKFDIWLERENIAGSIQSSGLHLKSGRINARYVVVDRVDKTPTGN